MRKIQLVILLLLVVSAGSAQNKEDWQSLFNGKDLTGWHQLNGKAKYHVENGEIVGTTVSNTPNSFLTTDKDYADFILELDLLVDNEMNSGIQFRSISKPEVMNGRVHGYQCEVDPSARAWSGGIYDEARRGWLYTGELNPAAKSAFKRGQWNHYRIECVGNSIRTWLNDIPVAYVFDDLTTSGLIALQVHAIEAKDMEGRQIRWKNIRIKTTGLKATETPDVFVVNLIPNNLAEAEKQQGWELLFDGKTAGDWKGVDLKEFPAEGWKVVDGTLMSVASTPENPVKGVDIITNSKYSAFDLQFEFNFAEGANSGVKYFTGNGGSSIGLEYQILDDKKHPDAKMGVVGNRTLGSLYDLIPADKQERFTKPAGQWNIGRIVVYPDNRVEHWLNGMKVVEYVRGSNIYKALVARSKYATFEGFGMVKEAPVLLQYHNDQVKYRSLKIKKINTMNSNRRNFLKLSGLGMAAVALPGITQAKSVQAKKDKSLPIQLGLASYTLRKMNLDDALAVCQKLEIKHISLKDFHLKLNSTDDQIAEVVKKCKDAGVELGSGGVIYMKTEAEVDAAFEYARKAGMNMIIGVPQHEMLPYAEKKVKEYNIRLAIHNHGPGDLVYPSCESAYVLIKNMDPRMGLCLDIGHTQRIQRDPSADLKDYFDRIFEIHMKDVTSSDKEGKAIEVGRGVIDIPGFLKTVLKLKFSGIISFEYEKEEKDPVPGLAESMGFVKGILAVIN